jgi:hypothetical protein
MWEYLELGEDGEPVVVRMTEGQILSYYWDWWSQAMREFMATRGRMPCGINPTQCIEDWATVHWAVKVPEKNSAQTVNNG